ncbi:hypothetical protein EPN87_00475 [archaeon]|nr:MAG: hypothetical protein EPN87_00475 [archaeon]
MGRIQALIDIDEIPGSSRIIYDELEQKLYVKQIYATFGSPSITALIEADSNEHLQRIKNEINGIGCKYVGNRQTGGVRRLNLRLVMPEENAGYIEREGLSEVLTLVTPFIDSNDITGVAYQESNGWRKYAFFSKRTNVHINFNDVFGPREPHIYVDQIDHSSQYQTKIGRSLFIRNWENQETFQELSSYNVKKGMLQYPTPIISTEDKYVYDETWGLPEDEAELSQKELEKLRSRIALLTDGKIKA